SFKNGRDAANAFRRNANNGYRPPVQSGLAPDNIGVASQMVLPVGMAQNHDWITVGDLVAGSDQAAQDRPDLQHGKEVRGYVFCPDGMSLATNVESFYLKDTHRRQVRSEEHTSELQSL